jgi:hypothetical protein
MNQPDPVGRLNERICRLERHNRRLCFALLSLVALGVGLVVGAAKAAPKATTLEASRFVLKDPYGEVKGEFLIGPDGGGRMILYSHDKRPVAQLPFEPQILPIGH